MIFCKFPIFVPYIADPGFSLVENDFVVVFIIELGRGCVSVHPLPGSLDHLSAGKDNGISLSMNAKGKIVMIIPHFAVAVLEHHVRHLQLGIVNLVHLGLSVLVTVIHALVLMIFEIRIVCAVPALVTALSAGIDLCGALRIRVIVLCLRIAYTVTFFYSFIIS